MNEPRTTPGMEDMGRLIDDLFKLKTKPGGKEYKYQEVADFVEHRFQDTIDPSYVGKLRRGVVQNPTKKILLYLASFFEVPITYFYPELSHQQELKPEQAIRAALRSYGIGDEAETYLAGLANLLQKPDQKE